MAIAVSPLVGQLLRVVGLTVLSFLVAVGIALLYRWYVKARIPAGVTLLGGVSAVALYLNTRGALGAVAQGQAGYLAPEAIVFNSVAFVTAGAVTPLGQRVGDRLAVSSVAFAGVQEVEGEVSQLVRTVGRLTAVTLPEEIDDIPGYDPVPAEVKATIAGKTLLFPKGLTVEELRSRLVTRLKADYDIGYVDVDLTATGQAAFLALGRRVAGIGPTLGPGAGAVAVETDPPNAAGSGDLVQLWDRSGDTARRVATGEIRGVAGDVVTLALDEHEARAIAGGSYRLVTLPTEVRPEREFAGLLRAADETMAAIPVEAGASLVDRAVGDLGVTVVAIKPPDGPIEALPARSRTVEAGDRLYVVARPDAIRRLETGAVPT
ncbi:MAG: cation:proton antiporter regulatory subunit [Halodesulfurarchaeum sp.]